MSTIEKFRYIKDASVGCYLRTNYPVLYKQYMSEQYMTEHSASDEDLQDMLNILIPTVDNN